MNYVIECGLIEQEGLTGTLETFVGKKKELLAGEKSLNTIIQYVKNSYVHGFEVKSDKKTNSLSVLNTHPANIELEKVIAKLFRFKSLRIRWVVTPLANASTYPNSLAAFDKNYKIDSDGIDYNDMLHAVINMNVGLISTADLNSGELMAILLHEIGHIFDTSAAYSISLAASGFHNLIAKTAVDGVFYYGGGKVKFYEIIDEIRKSNPKFFDKINYFANTIGVLGKAMSEVNVLTMMFAYAGMFMKKAGETLTMIMRMNPIHTLMRYNMEKNADKFAVDYGYGKESISAHVKLKKANGPLVANKIPIASWIYDFNMLPFNMMSLYIAGYPSDLNRARTMIDDYEKYLKDPNVPEEAKAQIALGLKEMKRIYNWELSIKNDQNKKEIFTWASRNMSEFLFRGKGDIREFSRLSVFNSRS